MTTANAAPPPPYSRTAPAATSLTSRRPTPEVTILLLGSPGVGKSSFLSALHRVRDGHLQGGTTRTVNFPQTASGSTGQAPNPSSFHVNLFNRPYKFVIYRSESTLFVDPFPQKVDFVIFSYAVDSRESLYNCQFYWRKQFADRYERELGLVVPVMLIGLKRDARTNERRVVGGFASSVAQVGGQEVNDVGVLSSKGAGQSQKTGKREEYVCVMPEEGVKAAQEMACDKYAECSALTGELMWEALEDITRTACLTTTENGGFSSNNCTVM